MEIYKPEKPWYTSRTQSRLDKSPTAISARLEEPPHQLLAVYAPTAYCGAWTCALCTDKGMIEAELPGIDRYGDGPDTWLAARGAAIDMMTERLKSEIEKLQQTVDSLQKLR